VTPSRRDIERTLLGAMIWLAGCGGGDDGGDEVVVRTVGPYNDNAPEAGVRVQINDGPWQTTNEEGETVFSDVTRPYSVMLAQNLDREVDRIVLQLIDRDDDLLVLPVFTTGDGGEDPTHYGSISGSIAGRSAKPGSSVLVFVRSMAEDDPVGEQLVPVVPEGDAFTLPSVVWRGEPTHSFTLHAIESEAKGFTAAGTTVATLSDPDGLGGTVTDAVLELVPVEQEVVRGTVAMPEGLDDRSADVELVFEEDSYVWVSGSSELSGGEFDFAFPRIEGTTARLSFRAHDPQVGGASQAELALTLPVEDLDVTLPVPVELVEPEPGAVVDADTVFRWTAVPGAEIYSLSISCPYINYRTIETRDTQATLPAIPDLDLPRDQVCSWAVARFDGPAFLLDTVERPAYGASASSPSRQIAFQ
jgi:hypothetical protein